MGHKKDWAGQKINRLTFIKPSEKRGKTIMWECLCDCGEKVDVRPYHVSSGHTKSCGCLHSELFREKSIASNIARAQCTNLAAAKKVWRNGYTDSGLEFELFYNLSQMNCHYCNRPPHRTVMYYPNSELPVGTFTYNGLDRLDSSIGHVVDNVVTCCLDCNRAKSDRTYTEFLSHIKRMYDHLFTPPTAPEKACDQGCNQLTSKLD